MSKAIAEQDVEYYVDTAKTLVLAGKIEIHESEIVLINNIEKRKIKFTHSLIVTTNNEGAGLVIQQPDEFQFTILFDENLIQWLRMIHFYITRFLTRSRHVHPLTMIDYGYGTCKGCAKGIHTCVDQKCFFCEFCPRPDVFCYDCYRRVDAMVTMSTISSNHNHVLYEFTRPPVKKLNESVICSQCEEPCEVRNNQDIFPTYHCLECLEYVECGRCLKTANMCGVHESLDLRHLNAFLVADESGREISMKDGVQYPAQISLITEGYWDLSNIASEPANNAYFEVEFLSFDPAAIVGVGVGNEIFNSHKLLGNQQNSFAYHSNGEIRTNFDASGTLPGFGPGDTIGCGLLLDNYSQRQIYFTQNGKILGGRLPVHLGMNCFPGVCLTKESFVKLKVNFSGPFKFDLNSIPDYRSDSTNYFDLLPNEVMQLLLQYVAKTPAFPQMQLVCKYWRDVTNDNSLWCAAFLYRWPNQNPRLKMRDWKRFYQKRKTAMEDSRTSGEIGDPIENCEFGFQCPLIWQRLVSTPKTGVSHCRICDKDVYAVADKQTLQAYANMGRCVVLNPKLEKKEPSLHEQLITILRPWGGRPISGDDEEDYDDNSWD